MVRVYVDMVGDLFHYGHVNMLKQAKELKTTYNDALDITLVVGIHNDDDVESYKRTPIMSHTERCAVVEGCKYVDEIIENAPLRITENYINKHNIDLVAHAHDHCDRDKYEFMYKVPIRMGIFKRLEYTQTINTTTIIRRIQNF